MPRNFGVRDRGAINRFWNEPANDNDRDPNWPYYVIGAAVAIVILVAVFV